MRVRIQKVRVQKYGLEYAIGHSYFIRLARLQCESLQFRSPRLSSVSRQLSKTTRDIRAKFRHLYKKSGSESKIMTLDFSPEVPVAK